jgi:hypothetical protein
VCVKIMFVFTVLVSLPNKTCSKHIATNISYKAKQVDTLRKENIMLRRTYPKEADHLEEYGSRQRKKQFTHKDE